MFKRTAMLFSVAIMFTTFSVGCMNFAPSDRFIAVLTPTAGSATSGIVQFYQTDEGVRIVAAVSNLTPGDHGFHIHQWGDISLDNGKAAGGHFNPEIKAHGARDADHRHVGDLGNLSADSNGVANYEWTDPDMDLAQIIGRGVIVHAKKDDYGQPTGNAGARVAQGVIGVANDEE